MFNKYIDVLLSLDETKKVSLKKTAIQPLSLCNKLSYKSYLLTVVLRTLYYFDKYIGQKSQFFGFSRIDIGEWRRTVKRVQDKIFIPRGKKGQGG